MSSLIFRLGLALAAGCVLSSAAQAQSLQPGLWELRTLKHVVDGQDMAAQMAAAQQQMKAALAKMPAAQRKQMESQMAGLGAGLGGAHRMCISPAMAAQDKPALPEKAQCDPPKMSRSGNRTQYEFSCRQNGDLIKGKGESVVDASLVRTKMDMTTSGTRGKHTMATETEMRFISADCGAIRPLDQPPPAVKR